MILCPVCFGNGTFSNINTETGDVVVFTCLTCDGSGEITAEQLDAALDQAIFVDAIEEKNDRATEHDNDDEL